LECFEGDSTFRVPGQRLGLLTEHGSEWGRKDTEVLDESMVEVSEAEESLKFFNCIWLRPVPDGLDLPLVHLDTIGAQDVTEELDCGAVELALLEL